MTGASGQPQQITLTAQRIDCGPCPYLPDRNFQAIATELPERGAGAIYRALLDRNFRRNGRIAYQPRCPGCAACQQLRVPVATFRPRRDQRRCWNRNGDLVISVHKPGMDDERAGLWRRWNAGRHGREEADDPAAFTAPSGDLRGIELHARDGDGRLVAVTCCDIFPDALSSISCYFAPEAGTRALGTFMVLAELEHCRAAGLAWLYLGFHIADCGKMAYKARFGPHEVLDHGGGWHLQGGTLAV